MLARAGDLRHFVTAVACFASVSVCSMSGISIAGPLPLSRYVGSFEDKTGDMTLYIAEVGGRLYIANVAEDGAWCEIAKPVPNGMRLVDGMPSDYHSKAVFDRESKVTSYFEIEPTKEGLLVRDYSPGMPPLSFQLVRFARSPRSSDMRDFENGAVSKSCLPDD